LGHLLHNTPIGADALDDKAISCYVQDKTRQYSLHCIF
jgi:hypothetical protein